MDEADTSLFYDLMRYEHHFWRNRAAEKPGPEQNEFERANNPLIRAIVETSESLAVEAERLAVGLNYGDLEWYARTVLIKRFGSSTSYRTGIGIRQGTLTWKML